MEKNPFKKIEDELHHAKHVLLITGGNTKPKKKIINLLEEKVPDLTTVRSVNRSTKKKIFKQTSCLVLTYINGYFVPHPKYIAV